MAKENQGTLLHQHVEKIVLGATIVLLLLVVGRWVISSPRQVKGFRPNEIDKAQRREAEKIKKRHDNAPVPDVETPDVLGALAGLIKDPIPSAYRVAALTRALPPLPYPDKVFRADEGPALADLAGAVLAPEQPNVQLGYELPKEGETLEDKFVAHVAAVLDVGKISAAWEETLAGTGADQSMIFHAVEAQVQQMRPDGTWGPITSVKMRIPELVNEDGEPDPVTEIPAFDGNNTEDIQDAINAVKNDFIQTYILQPGYPEIYLPDHGWVNWRVHLPETRVSLAARELLEEGEEQPTEDTKSGTRIRTGVVRPSGIRSRRSTTSGGDGHETRRRGSGRPTRRPKSTDRPRRRPAKEGAADAEEGPGELTQPNMTSRAQQMSDGALVIWFHDVSLKSGKTYRYRLRLNLLNPLYTRTEGLKKGAEKDATIAKIRTPWSVWSDGRRVPSLTQFYISGHTTTATGKKINVEVFSRLLGQRVVKRFRINKGGVIGQQARVSVTDPIDRTVVSKTVDFATGAIAVNFDFRRRIYKGKSPDPTYTTAILYLDEDGRLKVRTGHDDARDEKYKDLRDQAKRTAKAVTEAKSGDREERR